MEKGQILTIEIEDIGTEGQATQTEQRCSARDVIFRTEKSNCY